MVTNRQKRSRLRALSSARAQTRAQRKFIILAAGAAVAALSVWGPPAALAQQPCEPAWSDEIPGFNLAYVSTLRVLDLGAGPRIFAGGPLHDLHSLSQVAVRESGMWRSFGPPISDPALAGWPWIHDVVVFDDSAGPAVFALAGRRPFQLGARLLKYVEEQGEWELIASSPHHLWTAAAFDDGTGPALYIGGNFASFDSQQIAHLARWRGKGHAWEQAAQLSTTTGVSCVSALHTHDDGTGEALYIAGRFESVNGTPAQGIARWDGAEWSALGEGVRAATWWRPIPAIESSPGSANLYLAGMIEVGSTPAARVLKWDGHVWSSIGEALTSLTPESLLLEESAGGDTLYIGGTRQNTGIAPLLRIELSGGGTGGSWTPVPGPEGHIHGLARTPEEAILVGGHFSTAGAIETPGIAAWDGASWHGEQIGVWGSFIESAVTMIRGIDLEGHRGVYISGWFHGFNQIMSNALRFDGESWHAFGDAKGLRDLVIFDDGGGPALFGATETCITQGPGWCNLVGRWNGSTWEPLGGDVSGPANLLEVLDHGSGPVLYGANVQQVLKWDGAAWVQIASLPSGRIEAIAAYDDGSGPALYIGGRFASIEGAASPLLARWNGSAWTTVGGGLGPTTRAVYGLEVFDDGSGVALYVGGDFITAGGITSPSIARWDGEWSSVGGGIPLRNNIGIMALAGINEGGRQILYAGGNLPLQSGRSTLFRWDGLQWTDVGGRGHGPLRALAAWNDGHGDSLWVGGRFSTMGGPQGARSAHLARLNPCNPRACYANCDGSAVAPILNIDDFICFINEFAYASNLPHEQQLAHSANCDNSTTAPVLTMDDFTCFINAFAAGCP